MNENHFEITLHMWAQQSSSRILDRLRDSSPRGCKNYRVLPRELTEKLTGTAVRA